MKIQRLVRFCLLCAFSLLALSAVEAGTEMDRAFGRLERDYKKLKTALEAPADTDRHLYVKLTGEMLDEARKARELDPEMIAQVAEAEREKFVERFRADMDAFIANIGKLEEALKNSRWDEAKQLMETLWQNKKDGHKAFIKRKKK
jgi:soluble cytochrome b562